jgi:hypothetical protein
MSRLQVLVYSAIVFLAVLLGAFFVSRLEKRLDKVEFGPNAEARNNPRLAAMRLLEHLGVKSRVARDPEVLPAAGSIVMLPSSVFLDGSRVARWRDWVNGGGILMLGLDLDKETRDRLIDGLVRVEEAGSEKSDVAGDKNEPEGEAAAEGEDAEAAGEKSGEKAKAPPGAADSEDFWTFEGLDVPAEEEEQTPDIRLAMRPRWFIPRGDLERCETGYYVDEGGILGVFKQGEGHLVLVADDTIFDNHRIAGVDHSVLLWQLVTFFGQPPEVVVLLGDRIGLGSWLWRVAWPLLLPLALLTLFFVWEKAPRFGPLVERKKPGQRGLRAHLKAASAFLWRHHEQVALLEPLRAEVLRLARLSIPGWPSFSAERCRAELARIAGLPEPAIEAALRGAPGGDPHHFVNLVATLEKLRKAL